MTEALRPSLESCIWRSQRRCLIGHEPSQASLDRSDEDKRPWMVKRPSVSRVDAATTCFWTRADGALGSDARAGVDEIDPN